MKKLFLFALALLSLGSTMAVPAYRGVTRIQQPDGSYVSLRLHGYEYHSFTTTDDGYTVVKADNGYYVYAQRDDKGKLRPTKQVAHEMTARKTAEKLFLADKQKMLAPVVNPRTDSLRQEQRTQRARRLAERKAARYDYSKFRGLILLIEFNDCSFKYDNYQELMDEMVNKENYKGNSYTNVSNSYGVCTGSVRDFYTDCSHGQFVPEFDVVGPIKIDNSMYGEKWSDMQDSGDFSSVVKLMAKVADAADPEVDFSKYDGDGDGVVDLVYIIFAGLSSNYGGNDPRLIWPHQSEFYNPNGSSWWALRKDGTRLGHYACSTELYGTKQGYTLNGIGTITHEFGHVLGLPDFYDSDYAESGGESIFPGEWTVMAGGGYLNYGRTPAVYTLFERYALGWAMPKVINTEGSYTLESLDECNTGYRINTRVNKEYFLLENRQQVKWNRYLPGHGMLVFRVDSTNSMVWRTNKVNANPDHNYFQLIRAGGDPTAYQAYELASDSFPGTKRVRKLSNTTSPANLKTWSGTENQWGLENINERNGVITFDVLDANVLNSIEMEESISIGEGSFYQLTPKPIPEYAPYNFSWSSSDENVCTVDDNGLVSAIATGTAVITVSDNGKNQCTARCTVTVRPMDTAADIAELLDQGEEKDIALTLTDAQVLMTYKGDIYLRDATGHVVVKGTDITDLNVGDVLNGMIFGHFTVENKMAQLKAVEGRTHANTFTAIPGEAPQPREIYLGDATEADYGDLVLLKAALLTKVDGMTGNYIIEGENMARVYNNFGLKLSSAALKDLTKRLDIGGILITQKETNGLVTYIAMTQDPVLSNHVPYTETAISATHTDKNGQLATVYSYDGRRIGTVPTNTNGQPQTSLLPAGLYIVKTASGTTKMMVK